MERVGMKEMCTNKKIGNQSVRFAHRPYFIGRGNVVGQKEGEGPLAACFDEILEDDMDGEKSWEKAECKMLEGAMEKALQRAELTKEEIDIMLSGDLLNQIMSSSFTARNLHIPFLGLYGACSTMTESMLVGSMLIDGGFAGTILAGASSHFCTAERQFRMPVEHGNQRPPSAQWTATAAGAVVLSDAPRMVSNARVIRATEATVGTVDQKFLDEIVHLLGLEDKLKNMPNNLSGGQQQRVAIARALITKPAIVLADEPTGNLDSKTSAEVLGLIKRTSAEFRQTVVMITHNDDIARLADRIVRIEDGKIVE